MTRMEAELYFCSPLLNEWDIKRALAFMAENSYAKDSRRLLHKRRFDFKDYPRVRSILDPYLIGNYGDEKESTRKEIGPLEIIQKFGIEKGRQINRIQKTFGCKILQIEKPECENCSAQSKDAETLTQGGYIPAGQVRYLR